MRFWDSSAVVPLLVEEERSADRLRELETDPVLVVWWGTPVECTSALQRLVREGALTQADADQALIRLAELVKHWVEVEPTPQVRQQAARLLRVHALRAADALQLAAAIIAADYEPIGFEFLTGDQNLAKAASQEGFNVRSGRSH